MTRSAARPLSAAASAAVSDYDWAKIARDVVKVYAGRAACRVAASGCERLMSLLISLIIIAVIAMTGVYVSWRAGRLDRLHARVETAQRLAGRRAGQAQLGGAGARHSSGLLDPATSVLLADLAHDARSARPAVSWPRAT